MNDAKRQPLRQSRRSEAYDSFTEHLLARNIRPGQFISQRELVEITGMPLGAIRELIPRLETDGLITTCLLYTSPSPRDLSTSRMPSSA